MNHIRGSSSIGNMDYPVFSENIPAKMDICIFNTEYRVLKKMKRIDEYVGRQNGYQFMMRELLTAANGVMAYSFPLEILLSHPKEYRTVPKSVGLIPMTVIAWKNVSGCIFCSVERIFMKWNSRLPLEENLLSNAYMEQATEIASKLLQEHYEPLGVIGKGDYIRTLRSVFVEQFGYRLI